MALNIEELIKLIPDDLKEEIKNDALREGKEAFTEVREGKDIRAALSEALGDVITENKEEIIDKVKDGILGSFLKK
ncbi:MAG: hypothetical protein IIZ60_05350 [Clostridia bacterium]|nr:hypothetical protein [Clostridia bacterium]